ncbi:MAG TPA: ABC transporter permease [Vicinamibacterales bacterium]|nr:ABC transporter permease [Vicinamibacterales bacterium]
MIERLFRLLLALLPRDFRTRFGGEMLATARAIDAERPRRPSRTIRAVCDALLMPFSLRAELRHEARSSPAERRTIPMEAFVRDLQFAWRGLRREPSFTAFCVITLALGIGANAAMFGIADRLLLSGPDHVRDADRVVRLFWTVNIPGRPPITTDGFGYVSYELLNRGTQSFAGVASYAINDETFGTGGETRLVKVGYATADLFTILGVQPARGRFFTADEDRPSGAISLAVLSDEAARTWFPGAEAIGQSVTLGERPFTVIGVAPPGFTGPQLGRVDAWVPGTINSSRVTSDWTTSWNAQWLRIVGRLAPGVTLEQAGQEATAIHRRGYGGTEEIERQARLSVAGLGASDSGTETADARIVRWLMGVSALVVLIACANIANLLLARGLRRGREVAIRAALGASRLRVARLLLIEAVLLAGLGSIVGLAVAYEVGAAARALLFDSIAWTSSPVNVRVLGISAALAIVTGLAIGLIPALRSSRTNLTGALKTGAREGGSSRSRLRTALTVTQAALSVVLLVGAGLFVRSLWNAYTLDLGFDPDRVTVVSASREPLSRYPAGPARVAEQTRRRGFYREVLARVRAIPGVEHASIAVGMPFGNRFTLAVRAEDVPELPKLPGGGPGLSAVSEDYFETMGTAIRRGRAFTAADGPGSEPVAIVSELMASTIWPGSDAIGKCLLVGPAPKTCTRIVGVAENTHRSRLRENPVMHYYIPAGQEAALGFGGAVLLLRTDDRSETTTEVRRLLAGADRTITYIDAETVREQIDPQMRPWKLGASVFAISGLLALVVASIGLYSVMSYLIAGRRHEIGVRMALGARDADIVRLVLGGSVAMALAGVILGEAIAAALGPLVAPLLFNTSARDPLVYGGVGVLLLSVALVATAGPAMRARRVSALEALRTE